MNTGWLSMATEGPYGGSRSLITDGQHLVGAGRLGSLAPEEDTPGLGSRMTEWTEAECGPRTGERSHACLGLAGPCFSTLGIWVWTPQHPLCVSESLFRAWIL